MENDNRELHVRHQVHLLELQFEIKGLRELESGLKDKLSNLQLEYQALQNTHVTLEKNYAATGIQLQKTQRELTECILKTEKCQLWSKKGFQPIANDI